jgi:hypothetical protein
MAEQEATNTIVTYPDGYATIITHQTREAANLFLLRMANNPHGVGVRLVENMRSLTVGASNRALGRGPERLEEEIGIANAARYQTLVNIERAGKTKRKRT